MRRRRCGSPGAQSRASDQHRARLTTPSHRTGRLRFPIEDCLGRGMIVTAPPNQRRWTRTSDPCLHERQILRRENRPRRRRLCIATRPITIGSTRLVAAPTGHARQGDHQRGLTTRAPQHRASAGSRFEAQMRARTLFAQRWVCDGRRARRGATGHNRELRSLAREGDSCA